MTTDVAPIPQTTSTGSNGTNPREEMPSPGTIKSLLGSWEQRASASSDGGMSDVMRLAVSPRGATSIKPKVMPPMATTAVNPQAIDARKSTRQSMEDLAVFASPREIKKKFIAPSNRGGGGGGGGSGSNFPKKTADEVTPSPAKMVALENAESTTLTPTFVKATQKVSVYPPTTPPPPLPSKTGAIKDMPNIGSIRDRMKAFEQKTQANNGPTAPWMSQGLRGKRGSVLDKFTPKPAAKPNVLSQRKPHETERGGGGGGDQVDKERDDLPKVDLLWQETPEEDEKNSTPDTVEEVSGMIDTQKTKKEPVEEHDEEDDTPTFTVEDVKASIATATDDDDHEIADSTIVDETEEGGNHKDGKIDRDTLVLEEIRKMIRDTEDNEIEDEMDEEVKECLEKAALQSPAYTRRWYDALTDSWIHCPSLATIIMDFSLIEAAEALYGEELPMLYTVSLRAVAAEVMQYEEELPEYVYRLAS